MLSVCQDFMDEVDEFHAFLVTLDEEDWKRETLFMNWTAWDVLAHLHYFDEVSIHAAQGEEAFAARRAELMKSIGAGLPTTDLQRNALGHLDAESLLKNWKSTAHELARRLGECHPKDRLPWFGPDMGVQMFTTARYMETWAHAQEVYDLKGVARTHSDRIRNIVAIGVRTFGWTFVNRKLELPGPPPYVRLTAPSGEIWEFNDPSDSERIEGSAVDFCMTVTQVRNVADTDLDVQGEVANRWMEIAQCFAGVPVDPPAQGVRKPAV